MIRANNVISATSSTGTGPFTLTAAPTSLGVLDLYTALSGQGYGTSQPIPVPLVLTEYTDSTFTTAKQKMGFIGGVTLNTSLTTTTVTVSAVLWTQTNLNTSTPVYSFSSPAAITVGVAANTLIAIDPTAEGTWSSSLSWNKTVGDGWLVPAFIDMKNLGNTTFYQNIDFEYILPVYLAAPILAKRMGVCMLVGSLGGTAVIYLRLYAKNNNGLPGKLLADYTGASGVSTIVANNTFVSATVANPPWLTPGLYFASIVTHNSGTSTPGAAAATAFPVDGTVGTKNGTPQSLTSSTINIPASDPAPAVSNGSATAPIPFFRDS